ncbi:MAG: tryptophan--tRNA ligase [Clostridia bacterium]|nr:tryptophan--tRNA ligase [Clostridia bacterium]
MKRVLTGIKPTGYAHIGNYFGAIKPAIELSNNSDFECFYFLADYHALNTLKTKEELELYTKNIACTWLACGLDPNKIVFYKQSDIPEIFELCWILSNVTPKGLMNRAHAYKAMVEKNQQNGDDADAGVNMGLYNYPILMASDILLFGTNVVPVGLDQKQHIEMARDIANSFNSKYGKTLVVPEEYIQENVAVFYGLDGRKMSKSYGNTIQLFDTEENLRKTINKIVTDSRLPGEPKDADCTINKLYKFFAPKQQAEQFEQDLKNGLGWGEAKKQLFAVMNAYIAPMREKFDYYMAHFDEVEEMLKRGAEKARKIAREQLDKVRLAIGAKK